MESTAHSCKSRSSSHPSNIEPINIIVYFLIKINRLYWFFDIIKSSSNEPTFTYNLLSCNQSRINPSYGRASHFNLDPCFKINFITKHQLNITAGQFSNLTNHIAAFTEDYSFWLLRSTMIVAII